MKHRDARRLSRTAQAELRRLGVKLVLEQGYSFTAAADLVGIHPDTMSRWVADYGVRGEDLFVASDVRGHRPRALTDEEEQWVLDTLSTHPDPRKLGFESSGWTLETIRQMILQQFDHAPHLSKVHAMLVRRGFRSKVTRKRATERKEEDIERFQEEIWPAVVAEATENEATVVFLDEAQVRADEARPRTWAKRGTRPVVYLPGVRKRINVISAVSLEGKLWFRTYSETLNAERFCGFLDALHADLGRPRLVVVLDQHPVHRARAVTDFLQTKEAQIALVPLPTYAPELNPQENVWAPLKRVFRRDAPLQPGENLERAVAFEMRELQQDPPFLQRLFRHPDLAYLHDLPQAA